MIGGNSTGSGWSFFRSSSAQSPREQARVDNALPASESSSTASILDDSPQSGNHQHLRSTSLTRSDDDLPCIREAEAEEEQHDHQLHKPEVIETSTASTMPSSSSSWFSPSSSTSSDTRGVTAPPGLESGTSISAHASNPESSIQTTPPTHHLHSLTERKLEKAVLGRAVGLRQLVLLSNAFATRPAPPPPPQQPAIPPLSDSSFSSSNTPSDDYRLQYPYASTSRHGFGAGYDEDDEDDLEAGFIDYEEDEAERKRREEDWLDSVLDEMLTDAEDDDDHDGADEDAGRQSGKVEPEQEYIRHNQFPERQRRQPATSRSEREFREPYVHLSLKHAHWHPSTGLSAAHASAVTAAHSSSASTTVSETSSLAAQHAAMLQKEQDEDSGHLETASPAMMDIPQQQWLGDSGFMEPSAVPLPDSADGSPNSSAHSQASDDDDDDAPLDEPIGKLQKAEERGEEEEEEEEVEKAIEAGSGHKSQITLSDEPCLACQGSDQVWFSESQIHEERACASEQSAPRTGIPITTRISAGIPSPQSYTSLSLPELAYSATSLNTLSSSASHSIDLYTPGTSPPPPAFMARDNDRQQANAAALSQAEQEKQAWQRQQRYNDTNLYSAQEDANLEPQDIMLPIMDDLDLREDDERKSSASSSSSGREDDERTSSSGSSTSNEESVRTKRRIRSQPNDASLGLVPYEPAKVNKSEEDIEDDELRIPLYLPLSHGRHAGVFSHPTSPNMSPATPMPPLPPSLLSVMMGKTYPSQVAGSSSSYLSLPPNADSTVKTFECPRDNNGLPGSGKLRLPIFLPSEIVKSIYDSVDFGLPPRFGSPASSMSPLTSPSGGSAALPLPRFDSSDLTACPARASSAKSAPSSPARSRSKSLTQTEPFMPASMMAHASPGGLLFSSLGLFRPKTHEEDAGLPSSGSTRSYRSSSCETQRRRSLSSSPLDHLLHGHGHAAEASLPAEGTRRARHALGCRPGPSTAATAASAARNESRSPSRLRLLLGQDDAFDDDFEFGSI